MTLQIERAEDWLGQSVVGSDGDKIGKLEDLVFASDGTLLFGVVSTGLFGHRASVVSLDQATLSPDHIQVPYDKSTVKDAPQLEHGASMTPEIEDASDAHYGLAPRGRPAAETYTSAGERARMEQDAEDAAARARAHQGRAVLLQDELQQARAQAQDAQVRADSLEREHAGALADAELEAREHERLTGALAPPAGETPPSRRDASAVG